MNTKHELYKDLLALDKEYCELEDRLYTEPYKLVEPIFKTFLLKARIKSNFMRNMKYDLYSDLIERYNVPYDLGKKCDKDNSRYYNPNKLNEVRVNDYFVKPIREEEYELLKPEEKPLFSKYYVMDFVRYHLDLPFHVTETYVAKDYYYYGRDIVPEVAAKISELSYFIRQIRLKIGYGCSFDRKDMREHVDRPTYRNRFNVRLRHKVTTKDFEDEL